MNKEFKTDVSPCKVTDDELKAALQSHEIVFHEGVLGGAWPVIVE